MRTCEQGGRGTGGRVTGRQVIAELVEELRGSVAAAEQFEGEMRNLAAYAKALAQAIDCIRTAGGNRCTFATLQSVMLSSMGGGEGGREGGRKAREGREEGEGGRKRGFKVRRG